MRRLKPLILLALAIATLALWNQRAAAPVESVTHGAPVATAPTPETSGLPVEARATLALIARGGPYPHRQDDGVFGNYEGLLPKQPRGYYHEYTVETPGVHNRGARRIITGGTPPTTYYYTDDHYRSFRPVKVSR